MSAINKGDTVEEFGEIDGEHDTPVHPEISRRSFIEQAIKATLLLSRPAKIFGDGAAKAVTLSGRAADDVLATFSSPPQSAKPWVYWYWLSGNISREGITVDLEALQRAGVGGVAIMNLRGIMPGTVKFMTPEWRTLFHHAVIEADRLGLEINMNHEDGQETAGGPWIKPDHAMQTVVWTETSIQGPRQYSAVLPQPHAVLDYYRDIAVLAFRSPVGAEGISESTAPKITKGFDPPCILHEYSKPFTARSFTLVAPTGSTAIEEKGPASLPQWELQRSDDGKVFHTVGSFDPAGYLPRTFPLSPVRGRYFRLLAPSAESLRDLQSLTFSNGYRRAEFQLFPSTQVSLWEQKSGRVNTAWIGNENPSAAPLDAIPRASIVDLIEFMDESGRLNWATPEGHWTILRIGHTPTGRLNGLATLEGSGLIVDTLSRAGIDAHFPAVMEKLLEDSKPFVGKSFVNCYHDSWEAQAQNWAPNFREEFRQRRGYDLTPFLPVMASGRIVESLDVSERFLWDLRRTIADLIADNYWGRLAELCHEHGIRLMAQASGGQVQFMADQLLFWSKPDIPMCEFWFNPEPSELWSGCKLATSAAHIYGKKIVAAEAFTSISVAGYPGGQWLEHPFLLKRLGDRAFCIGINRLALNHCVHQPDANAKPGLAFALVGTEIDDERNAAAEKNTPQDGRPPPSATYVGTIGSSLERTQTWWEPGAAWMAYLARCQHVLQEGLYVADVCVLVDEGAPSVNEEASSALLRPVTLPAGYSFDCINLEALSQATGRERRIVLPSGMSYRLLVLASSPCMTPALARTIKGLAQAGAIIVGPRPKASPSLSDYPSCDEDVRRIADELWGQGKVVEKALPEVLATLALVPDFAFTSLAEDAELCFIHRRTFDADVYFISNQRNRFEDVSCTFRVDGKIPELWDPDSGHVSTLGFYQSQGGRTCVPLRLDPCGSAFVVFRRPAVTAVASVSRDSTPPPPFYHGLGEQFQGAEIVINDED